MSLSTNTATRRRFGHLRYGVATITVLMLTIGAWLLAKNPEIPEFFPTVLLQEKDYSRVISLAFSPDDKFLIGGSAVNPYTQNAVLNLWDLTIGEQITSQDLNNGRPPYAEDQIKDLSQKCLVKQHKMGRRLPTAVQFTPDGKQVVIGEAELVTHDSSEGKVKGFRNRGAIRFLDALTLQESKVIDLRWGVYGLAISPDGKWLAAIGGGTEAVIIGWWDLATAKEQKTISSPGLAPTVDGTGLRRAILFSHDNKKLLAGAPVHITSANPQLEKSFSAGISVVDIDSGDILATWAFLERKKVPATEFDKDGENR